jgi:hypothetical protein
VSILKLLPLGISAWLLIPAARAQTIGGVYIHVRDSDGTKPKAGATVTLTFKGAASGSLHLSAVQPGETVTDSGTYAMRNGLITIHFNEMEWEANRQPFQFDGCTLTLPFKALAGSPGAGTSVWRKTDAKCVVQVQPSSFASFSADEVTSTGGQRRRSRLFVAERAIRAERDDNGRKYVTIARLDRDVLWTLSLGQKTYTEAPLGYGPRASLTRERTTPRGCRVVGQEKLGQYLASKEECRIPLRGRNLVETYWTCKELGGIVIKQVSGQQALELENIRREKLDPALFEIPAGFRKVAK